MGVKKDPSGRRSIEVEAIVPGTVEEVWRAIASGPGISSWFAKCEMEEREGGAVAGDLGLGMKPWGEVKVWEPPHRFVTEGQPLGEEGPTFAAEWTVEAVAGGQCRVRFVQSLFADTDDWDGELENMERGYPGAFEILRLYLRHFEGQPSAIVRVIHPVMTSVADAWDTLTEILELPCDADGQEWRAPDGAPDLSGVVEGMEGGDRPKALLRLDGPRPGIASLVALGMGGMAFASVGLYLFGDDAASVAEREDQAWRAWLAQHFPPPDMGAAS